MFSLLVFEGQCVLNEIGFVSQFRPFFWRRQGTGRRTDAKGTESIEPIGSLLPKYFERESARGLARSTTPAFVPLRRGKQAAEFEYSFSTNIRPFYHERVKKIGSDYRYFFNEIFSTTHC
jgi:hypothetical protein